MSVWLNGALRESEEAHIDITDRGFLLGDGVFETVCVTGGRFVDLASHLMRLRQGTAFLRIPFDLTDDEVAEACAKVVEVDDLKAQRASLRITVTRGPGPRGLLLPPDVRPTVLIAAGPVAEPPSDLGVIVSTMQRNEKSPLSRIKSLNYLENVLARQEAADQRADEALMLNGAGNVACASAANLWLMEGNALVTPPISDGALPGIARQRIMRLASLEGLDVSEETITVSRLKSSDGLFLSNSLIGVCPVSAVNGQERDIGNVIRDLSSQYWSTIAEPSMAESAE